MPIDGGARRSRLSRNARYTASLRSPCSRITNFIDAPSLNNGLLIPIEIRPHVGTALAEARLSERLAQNPNFLAHNHKTCSVPLVADRREMMLRQCERRRILQEWVAARAPNQGTDTCFIQKLSGLSQPQGWPSVFAVPPRLTATWRFRPTTLPSTTSPRTSSDIRGA